MLIKLLKMKNSKYEAESVKVAAYHRGGVGGIQWMISSFFKHFNYADDIYLLYY